MLGEGIEKYKVKCLSYTILLLSSGECSMKSLQQYNIIYA